MTTKATNPKQTIGSDKMPYHLWPESASIMGALGLLDGALKYGRTNWRVAGVKASIYYDAIRRHMNAWFEGEDIDPDSGLHHFSHALASMAILADALAAGRLNDDRMVEGGYRAFLDAQTANVARLKAKHADKNPHHYTIQDDPNQTIIDPKLLAVSATESGADMSAFRGSGLGWLNPDYDPFDPE